MLLFLVGVYRTIGTTYLGGQCRFEPSCSQYATEALQTLPTHRAIFLILKRVLSCRPGGPYGYDPVPKQKTCSTLYHHHCDKPGSIDAT